MAGDQLVSELKEDELAHYGVLGMKWGVRKKDDASPGSSRGKGPEKVKRERPAPEVVLRKKLKDGGELTVTRTELSALGRWIEKKFPNKEGESYHNFDFTDADGKNVGQASFVEKKDKTISLEWVHVKSAHRGRGYATAVLQGVKKYAQDNGITKMTLEVPGNAPDANHIYTKLGFKEVGKGKNYDENDAWGGLTVMEIDIPQKSLKHSTNETFIDYIVKELDAMSGDKLVSELADDELAHYGVLGMKWGRRKDRGSRVTPSEDSKNVRELRTKKVSELSNKELRDLTQRQQLERQYAQLNPKLTEQGKNYVKAGIAFGATGVAVYNMVNSPAGKAAIKAGRLAYQKIINKL